MWEALITELTAAPTAHCLIRAALSLARNRKCRCAAALWLPSPDTPRAYCEDAFETRTHNMFCSPAACQCVTVATTATTVARTPPKGPSESTTQVVYLPSPSIVIKSTVHVTHAVRRSCKIQMHTRRCQWTAVFFTRAELLTLWSDSPSWTTNCLLRLNAISSLPQEEGSCSRTLCSTTRTLHWRPRPQCLGCICSTYKRKLHLCKRFKAS